MTLVDGRNFSAGAIVCTAVCERPDGRLDPAAAGIAGLEPAGLLRRRAAAAGRALRMLGSAR